MGVEPWLEQNSAAAAAAAAARIQQWTRVGEEVEAASIDEYRLALMLGEKYREEDEKHDGNGGEEDGPMEPILLAEEEHRLGDFLGACVANHRWPAWLRPVRPELPLDVLLLLLDRCIVDHWELEDVLFVIYWNHHKDLHCLSSFHRSSCACADDLPGIHRPREKSSFRRRKPQAMCCSRSDGDRCQYCCNEDLRWKEIPCERGFCLGNLLHGGDTVGAAVCLVSNSDAVRANNRADPGRS